MPTKNLFDADFVNNADLGDLEELQRELARLLAEVDPGGGLRETMQLAVGMLHRYAVGIVHVDTGRYKNSLFWDIENGAKSVIGHMGTNLQYSIYEERRGGSHATFDRTEREEGRKVEELFNVRITGGKK